LTLAVDTNVLVALLAADPTRAQRTRTTLDAASAREGLVTSPVVYAELLGYPRRGLEDVESLMSETRIVVAWDFGPTIWRRAGQAYAEYVLRRQRLRGGQPRRILTDFLVGAHALQVGALITYDADFYRTNFPELRLVVPG
jgi:predicted nucleic acid-binding protein